MSPKAKKTLQILGIALTAIALVILLGISYVISVLPSPAEIGQKIGFSQSKSSPTTTTQATHNPISTEQKKETHKSSEEEKILNAQVADYLMDHDRPLLDVCSSLKNAPTAKFGPLEPQEFGDLLVKGATTDDRNPAIESFLPMLRYVLRLSDVENLVKQVKDAVDNGEKGFLQKAQFYSQVVRAQQQIQSATPQIENVVDQTYLFFMLAKAVHARPDLADDPAVTKYCEEMQRTFLQKPTQEFSEMRESFNEFLKENEMLPEEIGYDPKYKTEIHSNLGSDSLNLSGGWIDSLIALPESKRATRPQDTDRPF